MLYIIAGANGSGKSTLANVLLKEKIWNSLTLMTVPKKFGGHNVPEEEIAYVED